MHYAITLPSPSHFLYLACSFSLCGLCLAQHPQSLRVQIDLGDQVINMWVAHVWLHFVSWFVYCVQRSTHFCALDFFVHFVHFYAISGR